MISDRTRNIRALECFGLLQDLQAKMHDIPVRILREHPSEASGSRLASGVVIVSFILALLYFGSEVLQPLAVAILLSFLLEPPIRRLRLWHVGRVTSVLLVVGLALAIIGALGFLMETEVYKLAESLPRYEGNLRTKVKSLQGTMLSSGALERASKTLRSLQEDLKEVAPPPGADTVPRAPVPVRVLPSPPEPFENLQNLIRPLVAPLAMAALVILFLLFILLKREDLRDRVLRLAGTRDLQRSTEAMNDAGQRLSRYFLVQSAVNASFGMVIGLALWLIGVPNPALWGMLAAILRFVPFIGVIIAAIFPVVLAAAVDPGWTMVLATAGLFLILESIVGQVVEPVLQGQHTGLSSVAIVVATLFWTLIWGPVGLILAVPITVCLAVLGRYVEPLSFIGVLLGDQPALAPHEGFYQRVLADDATEAADQAEEQLATQALSTYYDTVPMKALALAQADALAGRLTREKQAAIRDTIAEVVEDLADYSDEITLDKDAAEEGEGPEGERPVPSYPKVEADRLSPLWRRPYPLLLVSARSPLDESASLLLAHILEKRGLKAWVQPYSAARVEANKIKILDAQIVCVSYFGAEHTPVHVRYTIRRLRRLMPVARFLVCFWLLGADRAKLEECQAKVGAEFAAASLQEAADICVQEAMRESEPQAKDPASRPGPHISACGAPVRSA